MVRPLQRSYAMFRLHTALFRPAQYSQVVKAFMWILNDVCCGQYKDIEIVNHVKCLTDSLKSLMITHLQCCCQSCRMTTAFILNTWAEMKILRPLFLQIVSLSLNFSLRLRVLFKCEVQKVMSVFNRTFCHL